MNEIFELTDVKKLDINVFHILDDDWMLITAGSIDSFNTMTASWGSFGILWNKPVATIFVRPHRYTFSFLESNEFFTLSFFSDKYRKILNFCGQYSGKSIDKIKQTGLMPFKTPLNNIAFQEARLIFECKKVYSDYLKSDNFIDKSIIHRHYPAKDFHGMFIGEIVNCYVLNDIKNEDKGIK